MPYVNHNKINILHAVTSVYRQIVEFVNPTVGFPSLRAVVPGGEMLRVGDVRKFEQKFPSVCTLFANLGATEYGSLAYEPLPRGQELPEHIPVGRPLPGVKAYILGAERAIVPNGLQGEIAIHCDTAICEYWKDPERTARHRTQLADGSVVFLTGDQGFFDQQGRLVNLGRLDNLVKVNGYRIEIGDVESAFLSLDTVRGVAVIPVETANGVEMVSYWVPRRDVQNADTPLRHQLTEKLSPSMIPKHIIEVQNLPTLPNGKLDRSQIKKMAHSMVFEEPIDPA